MFKEIMDWFMANYEMYLLVGIGFALLNVYTTLKEMHRLREFGIATRINLLGVMFPILIIPFYPIFIIIWILNKLAKWQ